MHVVISETGHCYLRFVTEKQFVMIYVNHIHVQLFRNVGNEPKCCFFATLFIRLPSFFKTQLYFAVIIFCVFNVIITANNFKQ